MNDNVISITSSSQEAHHVIQPKQWDDTARYKKDNDARNIKQFKCKKCADVHRYGNVKHGMTSVGVVYPVDITPNVSPDTKGQ